MFVYGHGSPVRSDCDNRCLRQNQTSLSLPANRDRTGRKLLSVLFKSLFNDVNYINDVVDYINNDVDYIDNDVD